MSSNNMVKPSRISMAVCRPPNVLPFCLGPFCPLLLVCKPHAEHCMVTKLESWASSSEVTRTVRPLDPDCRKMQASVFPPLTSQSSRCTSKARSLGGFTTGFPTESLNMETDTMIAPCELFHLGFSRGPSLAMPTSSRVLRSNKD